jgi:hypothetical protein
MLKPQFEKISVISVLFSALLVTLPVSADDVDKRGFDLPRGSVSGTLTRQDTGEPIGRQWLTLKRRGWERSGSTDTYGRFSFVHVPAGVYELSFYDSGYKVRTFGPIKVNKDQAIEGVSFAAVPVDAQVAPYTYSDTYLPGQNVSIMVRSIRVTSVNVDVFKFDRRDVLSQRSELLDHKHMRIPADLKPMLTYRQPVSGGHQLRWRTTRVEPAFNDPGLYVIRVTGAKSEKLIPVLVTSLSLVTKRTPDALWVWATDLETGKPLSNISVSGEIRKSVGKIPKSMTLKRKTNRKGLVKFPGATQASLRFWGTHQSHFAYVDTTPSSRAQSLSFRTFIHTDRPAYRPGDLVHFKVIARENRGGVYRVKPDDAWSVRIRDAEGQVVYEGEYKTNLFGSFSGQMTLSSVPALGTWTLEASSGERSQSGRFKVLEYRKPDYKLHVSSPQKVYVQGNTIQLNVRGQYYFGAPLKGRRVQWTAYETPFRPWWYDEYWGATASNSTLGYGSVAESGTAVLDREGRATIELSVDKASIDRWVTIEAVISDDSGRQVSARHKVTVTRGTFSLGIRGNGKIFKVGETARFDIAAHRFDGKPAAEKLKVTASLETFSKEHRIWLYKTLATTEVNTDDDGKGSYNFRVPRDGFIRLEVAGTDRFGNPVVESSFIWATKNASIAGGYKKKSLDILADKARYEPGDVARILLNTSRTDPWILFALEGDGVFEPQVLKVDGNSRLVEVKLAERHAPNVYISVAFVGDKQFNSLQRSIAVSPKSKMLKVGIESNEKDYPPGETAKYTVKVQDRDGNPVRAELSLSLVDESLYAISKELAPKIGSFFYGHRPNPVRTAHSFPSRYLGGADKDGEDDGDGVRRDFKDTAYWNAHVTTNERGYATVEVPLPDNLTTWRMTARAVSKKTLVGHAVHRIQTKKDLMATVSLPRFARHKDEFEVVTMVHNRGEQLSEVIAELSVSEGTSVIGETSKTFNLPAGTSQALRWPVVVHAPSSASTVKVTVSAGELSDAEERTIPVHAVMVARTLGVSGSTKRTVSSTFSIPTDALANTAKLRLRLDSNLAATMAWSLESLAEYPYGCVEQTLNTFLPDLVASKALAELGVQRSGRLAQLPDMVRRGLSRLYEMQRGDGSFGWWYGDTLGDPYMTAYVVYGWSRAKALGYDIKAQRLERAITAAIRLYENTAEPQTRAFLVYAIAHTESSPKRTEFLATALPELRTLSPRLGAYAQSVIMLAHVAAGEGQYLPTLSSYLKAKSTSLGDTAFFPADGIPNSWADNAYESTAYAIRALAATDANDPLIEAAVRWLLAHRRGGMWNTTKDTAAVVEAIIDMSRRRNDQLGAYVAKVHINGALVGTLKVEASRSDDVVIDVDPRHLKRGDNELHIELDGEGTLYWTGHLQYGATPSPHVAGIAVTRRYGRVAHRVLPGGKTLVYTEELGERSVAIGDEIEVTLTMIADEAYSYVAVEDLLPAGFEVVPGETNHGFTGTTIRDDRIAFFKRTLEKGKHTVTYRLRAETAGVLQASPAVAWQMYTPSVSGNSLAQKLTVRAAD